MTRLVAVAAPELFAAALNRPWPDDLDGRVRCLDEGARALGLALSCAPWSPETEDRALAAELGFELAPVSVPGSADLDAETDGPACTPGSAPALADLDAVAVGLVGTPGGLGVLGAVSGPAVWAARVGGDPDEALDAASDLAAARVRSLGACGVGRVAVVETDRTSFDSDRAAEAHEPILRTAEHLRLGIFLVVTSAGGAADWNPTTEYLAAGATDLDLSRASDAAGATAGDPSAIGSVLGCQPARLGYERWASPDGCSEGLAFLPAAAFESAAALDRCFDERRDELAGAAEAVAAPLGPDADPAAVRAAAARLAELSGRAPASPDEPREEAR